MQLPRLEIYNTFAQLGIQQQRATITMRQPMAEVKMNQPQPEVEMIKTKSKLVIDQTEAFADANLKHPFRVNRERAHKAKREMLQSLSKVAAEGDRLMKIENQNKVVIPDIARQKSEPTPKQFNIGYMPSSAEKIKFYYQPSEIDIKVHKGKFQIAINPNYPTVRYNPGDIQIYLKQKASMKITAVGAKLNKII